jgi:hypothetical protein
VQAELDAANATLNQQTYDIAKLQLDLAAAPLLERKRIAAAEAARIESL